MVLQFHLKSSSCSLSSSFPKSLSADFARWLLDSQKRTVKERTAKERTTKEQGEVHAGRGWTSWWGVTLAPPCGGLVCDAPFLSSCSLRPHPAVLKLRGAPWPAVPGCGSAPARTSGDKSGLGATDLELEAAAAPMLFRDAGRGGADARV
jgi:hypothetical protein